MNRKNLLGGILLFCTVFFGLSGYSQNSIEAEKLSEDWSLISSENGIEIYIKETKCDVGADKLFTYGFLKIVNTSTTDKAISFSYETHYDYGCVGCEDVEYRKSLNIGAGETIEGDCTFSNAVLSVLINNPYQLEASGRLESIKLVNLNIK